MSETRTLEQVETKRCTLCDVIKPLDQFYRCGPFRRKSGCKACAAARARRCQVWLGRRRTLERERALERERQRQEKEKVSAEPWDFLAEEPEHGAVPVLEPSDKYRAEVEARTARIRAEKQRRGRNRIPLAVLDAMFPKEKSREGELGTTGDDEEETGEEVAYEHA